MIFADVCDGVNIGENELLCCGDESVCAQGSPDNETQRQGLWEEKKN